MLARLMPYRLGVDPLHGGIGFGWIAWRTNSFFYPFLIHWGLNVFVRLVAMGG